MSTVFAVVGNEIRAVPRPAGADAAEVVVPSDNNLAVVVTLLVRLNAHVGQYPHQIVCIVRDSVSGIKLREFNISPSQGGAFSTHHPHRVHDDLLYFVAKHTTSATVCVFDLASGVRVWRQTLVGCDAKDVFLTFPSAAGEFTKVAIKAD